MEGWICCLHNFRNFLLPFRKMHAIEGLRDTYFIWDSQHRNLCHPGMLLQHTFYLQGMQ